MALLPATVLKAHPIDELGMACAIDEFGFYVTDDTQKIATDSAPDAEVQCFDQEAAWWAEHIAVYLKHVASSSFLADAVASQGEESGSTPSTAHQPNTAGIGHDLRSTCLQSAYAGGGADPSAAAFDRRLLCRMRRRLRSYGVLPVPRLRRLIWPFFAGLLSSPRRDPAIYAQLWKTTVSEETEDVVHRDLGRTLPTHCLFVGADSIGQQSLYRLLKAYAALDPEVGYCQGMGFIASILLLHLPEEDAFWVFVQMLSGRQFMMRLLFLAGFPLLQKFFVVMRTLIRRLLPNLSRHFEEQGVDVSFFAAQWFMTLFAYQFPAPLVSSIWDMFFSEGWKVIFRVAIALLQLEQNKLIGAKMEDILLCLKCIHEGKDHATLIRCAIDVPVREQDLRVEAI